MTSIALIIVMMLTLLLQAIIPTRKMLIIFCGATVTITIAAVLDNQSIISIYNGVPWDVLVILLGLGIFSTLFARSRIFSYLAVWCSGASKGDSLLILAMFSAIMFFLSCTLNNLTALLLVLPVLLTILKALGVTQDFIGLCFSLLIVACNLGGAATPIGDFPAILLMGTGSISFLRYLALAFPMCLLIFGIILSVAVYYHKKKVKENTSLLERSLALTSMAKLYRNIAIDKTILYPGIAVFCLMFGLWIAAAEIGLSPGVICFTGVGIYMIIKNEAAEEIIRHHVDFESILFLTALFLMVSCMAGSGLLDQVAALLSDSFKDTRMLICALMICCGISTAIFSAGPSMATMLPIAKQIILRGDVAGDTVYVGLALSVCAGSSFLLTAATAGPLAQSMVEKSGLKTREGSPAIFNFMTFIPFGIVSFTIIQLCGLAFVLARI
ncbi:Putative transporter (arsenite and citrate). Homologie with MamN [Desulfamplus magnetovallimortis]|uniref:Putative transporter (Arsenite and citrate). Homologie with MamN n=1 Tax=Desulfamplus magnetovallimortis TaxID=1246637 RepID=L0R5F1_9BACT|nr:SLC13 family permease [Desulfamplus magnetovallimortis]CCO06745.1 Putative transporter (arsenite and citrate). Homologie with MamN [Desulfamplus magnetovallimortis BW-1]SLM32796.1 Putative transporter (arsenite and citrate). Homologie with MamN [Desulfamplus magnetovallimortis]